ncbi:MAG: DUF4197 domain-containing protein [Deltaproteobacteria bacterium]|nr:DUF4197 domain-containing protein [Candidatus Anaeroferrophillus wilburensis]MBN2890062.1 DUF4197 domain-containing protein [Deltaproteobacteria bacterium]
MIVIGTATAFGGWLDKGKELLNQAVTSTGTDKPAVLTTDEIGAGLKEALKVGTERVVAQLGQNDGFNTDPAIHIPLPDSLTKVQSALNKIGLSSMLDDLELRLNRAAETATPKAKTLFWQSIQEMTLDDVQGIYKGPDDAATRYFQGKMSAPLAEEMRPVVEESLAQVGAIQSYDNVMGKYSALPFVPDVKADLTTHVLDKGLAGIFHYVAKEEAAIRQNPVKRTTELLKRVFGTAP